MFPVWKSKSLSVGDFEKWTKDLDSLWVDFDRAIEDMTKMFPSSTRNATFPPVDIVKTDDGYNIILAVAGFKKEEIEVTHTDLSVLEVKGKTVAKTNENFIVKGIGTRQFTRRWQMNEGDEVKSVSIKDGLLTISINRHTVEPQVVTHTIAQGE